MSELRIPDKALSVKNARIMGKIQHGKLPTKRIEMYGAYQFSSEHDRLERNFKPRPPVYPPNRRNWLNTMYRLRINGKWYSPNGVKYEFFSKDQISDMLFEGLIQ